MPGTKPEKHLSMKYDATGCARLYVGTDPFSNLVQMVPRWPTVRCDGCHHVYIINPTSSFIVGDCPKCGHDKFSTVMVSSEQNP